MSENSGEGLGGSMFICQILGGGILGGYRAGLEGSGRDLGGLGEYWERIYQ